MKPGTKQFALLRYLASGARLDRFMAERSPLHDHVLNTSIANLEADTGIVAERQWVTVPCVGGTKTVRVKEYWLTGKQKASARKLCRAYARAFMRAETDKQMGVKA